MVFLRVLSTSIKGQDHQFRDADLIGCKE